MVGRNWLISGDDHEYDFQRAGCGAKHRGALLGRWTGYRSEALVADLITWRIEQAAIDQLRSMSDLELKDIGLTRSDIRAL